MPDADAEPACVDESRAHGSFELRSDGSFTCTPTPDYNGIDTFTYQAGDGIAVTAPTTVTINVTSVNDVPVVANDTIPLAKDGFYGITLANRSSDADADADADADGDALTATLVTGTQNGVLVFDGVQRAFTYKPNTGVTGQDSFTYKVNDGTVDSLVAIVTLVIS